MTLVRGAAGGLLLLVAATAATAQDGQDASFFRKGTFDGMTIGPSSRPPCRSTSARGRRTGWAPADIPDIYGPGAVLTVGNVYMKVTNFGIVREPVHERSRAIRRGSGRARRASST